jgi:hypothetical protein
VKDEVRSVKSIFSNFLLHTSNFYGPSPPALRAEGLGVRGDRRMNLDV